MNSLVYRTAALVIARRPHGLLISSHVLDGPQVLSRDSSFVRARTPEDIKRPGSVKPRNGVGQSTCRPVVAARSKRTTVPRHAASIATFYVVAWKVAS